jgi:hypothetical protein
VSNRIFVIGLPRDDLPLAILVPVRLLRADDIAHDRERALQGAEQGLGLLAQGHDLSHGLAVLGNGDGLARRRDLVEHGEKLRLALRGFHGFSHGERFNMTMVMTMVILAPKIGLFKGLEW